MGKNYDLIRYDRSCGDGTGENNEESYDQVIAIYLGLAVVEKLIPPAIQYNGESLVGNAKDVIIRMTDYLNSKPLWLLQNPKGDLVARGATNGLFFGLPLRETARRVSGIPRGWLNWFTGVYSTAVWREVKILAHKTNNNVLQTTVQAILTPLGNAQAITSYFVFNNNDNVTMFLEAATASRDAGIINLNSFNFINDGSGKKLLNMMGTKYKKEFFELLGSTLIGYSYGNEGQNNYWMGELNKFPCACNCIFKNPKASSVPTDDSGCANYLFTTSTDNPKPGSQDGDEDWKTPYPWTTPNRWAHWRKEELAENFKEFNGVDYLETFGAYMYQFHGNMGLWQRLRFGWDGSAPFPFNTTTIGHNAKPLSLKAVFDLSSRATLVGAQGANVNLYAGSKVDLLPGFDAQTYSNFEAAIKNYDCVPNSYLNGTQVFHRGTGGEDPTDSLDQDLADFTDYLIDTNIVIQYNDSSNYITDTVDYDNIDTSIMYIRYSANGDTTFVGLQPCYAIGPDNELVNLCDAQGRRLSPAYFASQALTVAPNPAADESFVLFSISEASTIQLSLFDVLGRNLSQNIDPYQKDISSGQYRIRINTANLSAGLYTLLTRLGNETVTHKISVVH